MNHRFGGRWTIEHWPDITRQCCQCLAGWPGMYLRLLSELHGGIRRGISQRVSGYCRPAGVDLRKPAEVVEYGRQDPTSHHLYGGWYHAVAAIISGRDAMKRTGETSWTYDLERLAEHFEFGFTSNIPLAPPPPFTGKQLVRLEFVTRVPWGLLEPEWTPAALAPNPESPVPNPPHA